MEFGFFPKKSILSDNALKSEVHKVAQACVDAYKKGNFALFEQLNLDIKKAAKNDKEKWFHHDECVDFLLKAILMSCQIRIPLLFFRQND